MKTGIFLTARLGSSRLPRKHLLEIDGQPILSILLSRITAEFTAEIEAGEALVVIASSDEPENRDFEPLKASGVEVFFGPVHNIPLRHLRAAEQFGLDAIVAVDGDDILCSVRAMRQVYQALLHGAQYVLTEGLPFGMNCFGYTRDFLDNSVAEHHESILETGWGKIFNDNAAAVIRLSDLPDDKKLRFTLDYEEDYQFFRAVISAFGQKIATASDADIVNIVRNLGLYRFNESISQMYWDNFYSCIKQEEGS